MVNANMEIWDKVEKTNPDVTSKVNQRGGFTAIDAYSQIKKATEVFGPVGEGWGWTLGAPIFPPNDTVMIEVTVWHGNREKFIPVFGQKKLNTKNGPDEDAMKKAVTDGITKALSYLGFNADVFLGKFDDNKYVEEREEEEAQVKKQPFKPRDGEYHDMALTIVPDRVEGPEKLKDFIINELQITANPKNMWTASKYAPPKDSDRVGAIYWLEKISPEVYAAMRTEAGKILGTGE